MYIHIFRSISYTPPRLSQAKMIWKFICRSIFVIFYLRNTNHSKSKAHSKLIWLNPDLKRVARFKTCIERIDHSRARTHKHMHTNDPARIPKYNTYRRTPIERWFQRDSQVVSAYRGFEPESIICRVVPRRAGRATKERPTSWSRNLSQTYKNTYKMSA